MQFDIDDIAHDIDGFNHFSVQTNPVTVVVWFDHYYAEQLLRTKKIIEKADCVDCWHCLVSVVINRLETVVRFCFILSCFLKDIHLKSWLLEWGVECAFIDSPNFVADDLGGRLG